MTSAMTQAMTPIDLKILDPRMADAVLQRIDDAEIFIGVAAVADYAPETSRERKIKKTDEAMTLLLRPTVDILATIAGRQNPPYCVGFAAESHDLLKHAREKLERKGVPLIVGNLGPATFGQDDNALTLVDAQGHQELARADKLTLARRLVAEIARRLPAAS